MRGVKIGPFGPWWFVCDPRVVALPAPDVGGLVLLLAHWWRAGTLPADDAALAALSRLGEAWAPSRLRAVLAQFFRREGEALVSLDLAPLREREEDVRAKRRHAGRASAAARQSTRDQHLSSNCSTRVEHVLNTCSAGTPNASSGTALRVPDSAPPGGGVAAPIFSPHTPLIESGISLSASTSGGCRGEQPERGGGPSQMEMFPGDTRPKPPRSPRRGRASREVLETASVVVDLYVSKVQSVHKRTTQAEKNVAHYLMAGRTVEELNRAVVNYAAYCDRLGKLPLYRNAPHNFFSTKSPVFVSHLKEDASGPGTATGHPQGLSRVRDDRNDYERRVRRVGTAEAAPAPAADAGLAAARPEEPRLSPFRA